MPDIIRDGLVVADDWTLVPAAHEGPLPAGRLILPLARWLDGRAAQADGDAGDLPGVWLEGHADPAVLAPYLARLPLIALHFARFADGRGYSTAALLRGRLGFKGELRAVGDVLRDQLFYLQRVGFNAFAVRADKDIHDAARALRDFSVTYQASADAALPLFRRRRIPEAA